MPPIIGYWPIRALGEPIILSMEHLEQPYALHQYKFGQPSDYLGSEWPADKNRLELLFPNIPYFIDGDVKLTQCLAILRYIGRKYNFGPKTEEEIIRSDMFEQALHEILYTCFKVWYVDTKEELDKGAILLHPYLIQRLEQLSQAFGKNNFILGDRITYVDFLMFSTLDYINLYGKEYLKPHPNLKKFISRIVDLPRVIKYYAADPFYRRYPVCAPHAQWGYEMSQ